MIPREDHLSVFTFVFDSGLLVNFRGFGERYREEHTSVFTVVLCSGSPVNLQDL